MIHDPDETSLATLEDEIDAHREQYNSWYDGLLYAEELFSLNCVQAHLILMKQINRKGLNGMTAFDYGILDYINHRNRLIKMLS